MASVCFLRPPGSQMIYFRKKEKVEAKKNIFRHALTLVISRCIWHCLAIFQHCMALILLADSLFAPLGGIVSLRPGLSPGISQLGRGVSMARVGALHSWFIA